MAVDRDVTSLTDNAGYLLSRVGTAVQAGFKEVISAWEIRPLHFLILIALGRTEGTSQQELCRTSGVDSGNMVELIDTLERLGYAERRRDPRDRRRHLVVLTDDGRSAFTAMTEAVSRYNARFLAPLGQAEQAALISSLTKLYVTTPEGQGRPEYAEPERKR
jgi:DNA-binding MarR family transcriptional regulator